MTEIKSNRELNMLVRYIVLFFTMFAFMIEAQARNTKGKKHGTYTPPLQASLIVDASNGKVLHADKAQHKVYPASITKVMTLYLAFEALEKGKITMDTMLPVSKRAQNMRPLKLGLIAGQKISLRDAILGNIVKSANDASVVIAEGLAGTEEKFAAMMTRKAMSLGMTNTKFMNSSGWHDKGQYTTAVDLAKMGMAMKRDFPQYYHLFRKTSFVYNGTVVRGHNRVVENYLGAEGMKTGFTSNSGFNLLTSASRNGKSLIAVVTGGHTGKARDTKMISLLDKHFGVAPTQVAYKAKKKPQTRFVASNYKAKKRSKIRRV